MIVAPGVPVELAMPKNGLKIPAAVSARLPLTIVPPALSSMPVPDCRLALPGPSRLDRAEIGHRPGAARDVHAGIMLADDLRGALRIDDAAARRERDRSPPIIDP